MNQKQTLVVALAVLAVVGVLIYSKSLFFSRKNRTGTIDNNLAGVRFINASNQLNHTSWSSFLDTFTSPGVCVFDANNDGWQDLFFPGLGDFNTKQEMLVGLKSENLGNRLFLNRGVDSENLPKFEEATDKSGIRNIGKLGVGCAAADYDNDGDEDILVTNATKGVFYNVYGYLPFDGSGVPVFPPSFFVTDKTDGKYNYPAEGGVTLFQNQGIAESGTPKFTDVTQESGLTKPGNGTVAVWADFNNDGWLDLFVGNYSDFDFVGFTSQYFGGHYNFLHKNNGNGTFSDVTDQAGVAGHKEYVYTPDGQQQFGWNQNEKDFQDRTIGDPAGNTLAVAAFDYNNDGLTDLLVGDDIPGRVRLYKNLGNFQFEEDSEQNNMALSGAWMGFAVGDIDNDLDQDVFATNLGSPLGSRYRRPLENKTVMSDIFNPPNKGTFYPQLWKLEDGNFKIASKETEVNWGSVEPDVRWYPPTKEQTGSSPRPKGLEQGEFGFGTVLFDLENDGDLDLMWVGSLVRSAFNYINQTNPGRLLLNADGTGAQLKDIGPEIGLVNWANPEDPESFQNGRGLAVGDFNNDGYNDIVITNTGGFDGPDAPSLKGTGLQGQFLGVGREFRPGPTFLYISQAGQNNWLKLKLIGIKTNRSAIGAKITIEYPESGIAKKQFREIIGGGSYASASSLEQIFGLGLATEVDKITIQWPSGKLQIMEGVKTNQRLVIVEE